MAKRKSTPKRIKHTLSSRAPKERKDLAPWLQPLHNITSGVYGQLKALRCVLKTIEASDVTNTDEDVGAAETLFRRTLRDLEGLHTELDLLHGDLRYGREPRAPAA
jgi:hypothetical protein